MRFLRPHIKGAVFIFHAWHLNQPLSPKNTPESLMRTIQLTKEPAELYKILKFEGLVNTGGAAKLVISDGQVIVNGEVETRKRRKIVAGDTIEFGGEQIAVQFV
jgi:ribosome-associated protein